MKRFITLFVFLLLAFELHAQFTHIWTSSGNNYFNEPQFGRTDTLFYLNNKLYNTKDCSLIFSHPGKFSLDKNHIYALEDSLDTSNPDNPEPDTYIVFKLWEIDNFQVLRSAVTAKRIYGHDIFSTYYSELAPDNKSFATIILGADAAVMVGDLTKETNGQDYIKKTSVTSLGGGLTGAHPLVLTNQYAITNLIFPPYANQKKLLLFWDYKQNIKDTVLNEAVGCLTLSKDASLLAFSTPDRQTAAAIMDIETKKIIKIIPGESKNIYSFCFSPGNKYLLICYSNETMLIYDIKKETVTNSNILAYFADISENYLLCVRHDSNPLSQFVSLYGNLLDVEENAEVKNPVYPNPAMSKITISCNGSDTKLQVFNSFGVKADEVFYPQALEKIEYDCSGLPSGIYYCAVLSEGKIKKYSFVKN